MPGGTGASLIEAAEAWSWVEPLNVRRPRVTSSTEDYAPANVGQVRWVATPFYDRLIEVGRVTGYPIGRKLLFRPVQRERLESGLGPGE